MVSLVTDTSAAAQASHQIYTFFPLQSIGLIDRVLILIAYAPPVSNCCCPTVNSSVVHSEIVIDVTTNTRCAIAMSRKSDYRPMKRFVDQFPEVSGNTINGLGESSVRRPSPFFWHPPDRQTHGALQQEVTDYHRRSAAVRKWFSPKPPGGRRTEDSPRPQIASQR